MRIDWIGSLTQKYLLCLYDKHWGHWKGACGVNAGEFRDLCWLFISSDSTRVSKPSKNPCHIFSCAKPPWQSQTPTYYRMVSTFFFTPNSSVWFTRSFQSLIYRHWGNRIFTATKINRGATKPNMHGVPLSIHVIRYSDADTFLWNNISKMPLT